MRRSRPAAVSRLSMIETVGALTCNASASAEVLTGSLRPARTKTTRSVSSTAEVCGSAQQSSTRSPIISLL